MIFFSSFFLLFYFSCKNVTISNYQKYFASIPNDDRQKISQKKVLLKETNYVYYEPIYYNGSQIPNVFIDDSIIEDTELRYKVSCYLMNKLDLGIYFEMNDKDLFVVENKKIIGESIYYLCNKNYGRIHVQKHDGVDRLLKDKLIQDELDLIKERLRKENSLFLYSEPIEK